MRKNKDKINSRLAAISNAKPLTLDAPVKMRKPRRPMREPREPVFRPGKVFTAKNTSIRCVVRNISPGGARVRLEGAFALPEIVVLQFVQNGVAQKARVAWQIEQDVGLAYLEKKEMLSVTV